MLLALPFAAVAQTQPAQRLTQEPAKVANEPAMKPAFDLRTAKVQDVIRATAEAQVPAKAEPGAEPSEVAPIHFRAPRRLHHMDCNSFTCVAFTADNEVLYTIPRDQYLGIRSGGNDGQDEWLSCQSGNNLLSTFERYDKCRGVSIGLPMTHDLIVNLPLISLD